MIHSVVLPLTAGFALFMFGMKVMEIALHRAAGPGFTGLLERFTQTPARGMVASAGITAVLQSSTAVTVVTIGLVNAGLMQFPQTLGIILGTNIGTCLTTELLGLNLNKAAVPLLVGSSVVWLTGWMLPERFTWGKRLGFAALAAAGFACILLGMDIMKSMVPELEARGIFEWLVRQSKESPLWGITAGAAVTALIHSSAATIAMTMGLVSGGVFTPDLGIAVILGANVGTCVTAVIASIGGSRFGVYVAWSHVLLNIGGAALFYPLIPLLADVAAWMSGDPGSQIARAQTIFNVVCSLIALPLCYLPALRRIRTQ